MLIFKKTLPKGILMKNKIIILSGKQFCGKDTVAKILLQKFTDFTRIGLGDAIKLEYGEKIGLTLEEVEKNKSQYRADLQALGNMRRSEDSDYWIKKVISLPQNIIVPDVRVQREYDYFKTAGAFMIRVEASEQARAKRGTLSAQNDITETALDNITDWNYIVTNEGTYEDLVIVTEDLIDKIKKYFST